MLKSPHHASRTSSTEAFLDAVRPTVAVVSGAYRTSGRMPPHRSVLARYRRRDIEVLWTGRDGAVTVGIGSEGELSWSARLRPP